MILDLKRFLYNVGTLMTGTPVSTSQVNLG